MERASHLGGWRAGGGVTGGWRARGGGVKGGGGRSAVHLFFSAFRRFCWRVAGNPDVCLSGACRGQRRPGRLHLRAKHLERLVHRNVAIRDIDLRCGWEGGRKWG